MGVIVVPAKVVVEFRLDGVAHATWSTARQFFVPEISDEPGIKEMLDAWNNLSIELDEATHEPTVMPREFLLVELGKANVHRKKAGVPDLEFGHVETDMMGHCIRVNQTHWCLHGYRLRVAGQELTYTDPTTSTRVSLSMGLTWESHS